jgi:hypothetical protein
MRFWIPIVAMSVALLVFAADAATAQTASPAPTNAPMSKRALRQQDRDACSRQVAQTEANKFLECMANREAARKAEAAALKTAKRAECKKQADERNLRLVRRLRFIEKCMAAK